MADTAPGTPATTDLRMAVEGALGRCLAFRAGQAFGVPPEAHQEHLAAVTQAVVDVVAAREVEAERRAFRDLAAMCVWWTIFGAGIGVVLVTVLLRVTS
jgi:hypothetical protein